MSSYLIRPIPLCKGVRNKSQLVYRNNPGEKVEICCYVWYLQGGNLKILVDTGTSADYYHATGVPQQEHIQYLEEGLGKFGVQPADIDIVILTHLHADHVEQAKRFTRAKFFIQKEELNATKHPAMATEYVSSLYEGLDFKVINGDTRITDGVKALFTPGHTPGETRQPVIGGLKNIFTYLCFVKDISQQSKKNKGSPTHVKILAERDRP